jgi:hypothetical protein
MSQIRAFKFLGSCNRCWYTEPDGQSRFLKAAPDVDCGSSLHTGMVVTAVLYTVVVLVGFPLYISRALYLGKIRNTLLSIEYMQTYGAFYQQWKMEYVWWEAVVLFRKFCVGIILAIVQVPMFQGALCVLLIYISILLHLSALPYAEEDNNWLEITCLFCALIYISCGMVFYPSLDQINNALERETRFQALEQHAITTYTLKVLSRWFSS